MMQGLNRILTIFFCSLIWLIQNFSSPAAALTVVTGTYKLPAKIDAEVTTSLATELWAQVWRPDAGGPYPLLVFLHGNHATCGRFDSGLGIRIDDRIDYTTTGTCPAGYVPVPSHAGYSYIANTLASSGYVVVSINANRGINAAPGVTGDNGLNLRRGRLVLRHLEELAKWNTGTLATPPQLGFSLMGLMDFSHVGLMGHSRGGEGMRAALAQFRDIGSPWPARIGSITFEALFEIGPVDGQTSRTLNATGISWNVLLPGCDGDVSDLQGVKPIDRMLQIGTETATFNKSSLQVFGANHNFYNTQWQQSDSSGCQGQTALFPQTVGSAAQRATASLPMRRFFTARVGAVKTPTALFDPSYPLPKMMTDITQYARGFSPTPRTPMNFIVDDFNNSTGVSSKGIANQSSGLTQYAHGSASPSHDASQRAASIDWSSSGGFLQLNDSAAGVPINVSLFKSLEFRVALRCGTLSSGPLCSSPPSATGDVDFSISIANSNGTFSNQLALKSYAIVRRPAGSSFILNSILQTVRIPLTDFVGADLSAIRGVRFTFNKTTASSLFLANVRFDKQRAGPGGLTPAFVASAALQDSIMTTNSSVENNRIVAIRHLVVRAGTDAGKSIVEVEVLSDRAFPVGNSLPELLIGGLTFRQSKFGSNEAHRLIFSLPGNEFAALKPGDEVAVKVGGTAAWRFGKLVK